LEVKKRQATAALYKNIYTKKGLLKSYSTINIIIVQLMNIHYLLDKYDLKYIACGFFSFCVS